MGHSLNFQKEKDILLNLQLKILLFVPTSVLELVVNRESDTRNQHRLKNYADPISLQTVLLDWGVKCCREYVTICYETVVGKMRRW